MSAPDRGARWSHGAAMIALLVAGCRGSEWPSAPSELRLVVSEAWRGGTRLVWVDERGDRWAVATGGDVGDETRDEQASVSPDGRWLAFVSSRGRDGDRTSLWVMPAAAGATAVRVTDGDGDDVDPTWTPDSSRIVFARRTADWFVLTAVEVGGAVGRLRVGPEITVASGPRHHLAPSVSADGEIAYQEVDARGSRIAVRSRDGSVTFATDGPTDATPAWRPGGGLAFARRIDRGDGAADLDLWQVDDDPDDDQDAQDDQPSSLLELPGTDESGPRWSRDGRWLFMTSISRVDDATLPSVVYLDTTEPGPARMLRDQLGAVARQGPAIAPVALDARALADGPGYADALALAWHQRAFEREQASAAVDAGVDGRDLGL